MGWNIFGINLVCDFYLSNWSICVTCFNSVVFNIVRIQFALSELKFRMPDKNKVHSFFIDINILYGAEGRLLFKNFYVIFFMSYIVERDWVKNINFVISYFEECLSKNNKFLICQFMIQTQEIEWLLFAVQEYCKPEILDCIQNMSSWYDLNTKDSSK